MGSSRRLLLVFQAALAATVLLVGAPVGDAQRVAAPGRAQRVARDLAALEQMQSLGPPTNIPQVIEAARYEWEQYPRWFPENGEDTDSIAARVAQRRREEQRQRLKRATGERKDEVRADTDPPPAKRTSFIEMEATAMFEPEWMQGPMDDLDELLREAENARRTIVSGTPCAPADAALVAGYTCYTLNDWNYYYDPNNGNRLHAALGSPTYEDGEQTTAFETDLVRAYGHEWDHAGHVRAHSMGGTRAPRNVWPQGIVSNTMATWRQTEKVLEAALRKAACRQGANGRHRLFVHIEFDYNGQELRPNGGTYSFMSDNADCARAMNWQRGQWSEAVFKNSECGHVPIE